MYVLSKATNASMSRIAAIMRSSMASRMRGSVNIDTQPCVLWSREQRTPAPCGGGAEERVLGPRQMARLGQRLRPPAIFPFWVMIARPGEGDERGCPGAPP